MLEWSKKGRKEERRKCDRGIGDRKNRDWKKEREYKRKKMETTKLQTLTHQYIHTHTKIKRKKYDLYTPPFLIVNKRLPNKYFILFLRTTSSISA